MAARQTEQFDKLIATRKIVKRGDPLFRSGDRFKSLYVVGTGFLKSTVASTGGREQITGYHIAGELFGWDGINSGRHMFDAVALEDTEVLVLPYGRLEAAASVMPMLLTHIHKTMSREIVRDHQLMLVLGSMRAEERLAAFLLSLSQRFKARGYAHNDFNLRLSRAEIGSFLGLQLETVSRAFSRFVRDGLIEVNQKHVRIINAAGLRQAVIGVPG